jgi:hypothetical protein
MIPLRSRSDSWTFTPEPRAIRIESNFSRCPYAFLGGSQIEWSWDADVALPDSGLVLVCDLALNDKHWDVMRVLRQRHGADHRNSGTGLTFHADSVFPSGNAL